MDARGYFQWLRPAHDFVKWLNAFDLLQFLLPVRMLLYVYTNLIYLLFDQFVYSFYLAKPIKIQQQHHALQKLFKYSVMYKGLRKSLLLQAG